jgi:hypothetical protein
LNKLNNKREYFKEHALIKDKMSFHMTADRLQVENKRMLLAEKLKRSLKQTLNKTDVWKGDMHIFEYQGSSHLSKNASLISKRSYGRSSNNVTSRDEPTFMRTGGHLDASYAKIREL